MRGARVVHDPGAKLRHLKVPAGGKRPGQLNEYVIADSNRWYIWCYFFFINFGSRCWREIAMRLRGCVFRRKNVMKPWYLAIAIACFVVGAARALGAIRRGRRLPFSPSDVGALPQPATAMKAGA
jgi:hypothetical protein